MRDRLAFPHMRFPPIPKPEDLAKPFGPHTPRYSWLLWLTVASALGYVGWQGKDRTERNMSGTVLSLLLILLIFSKGVSSYYMFWIFPLLFVVYDPLPAFALCALFLVIGNLEFLHASFHPSTYWASIFARHTLFVGLLLHQILREVRTARLETQVEGA